jgi:hypothetical protein
VRGAADLRAQAEAKRHMSGIARRVGPGLSLAADRLMMLQHAQELEAEAVGLEAQADALDGKSQPAKSNATASH